MLQSGHATQMLAFGGHSCNRYWTCCLKEVAFTRESNCSLLQCLLYASSSFSVLSSPVATHFLYYGTVRQIFVCVQVFCCCCLSPIVLSIKLFCNLPRVPARKADSKWSEQKFKKNDYRESTAHLLSHKHPSWCLTFLPSASGRRISVTFKRPVAGTHVPFSIE